MFWTVPNRSFEKENKTIHRALDCSMELLLHYIFNSFREVYITINLLNSYYIAVILSGLKNATYLNNK